jgi:hypothetical protein
MLGPWWLLPLLLGVVIGAGGAAAGTWYYCQRETVDEQVTTTLKDIPRGPAEFEGIDVSMTPLDWIRAGRHLQKQRKAAKKGWVKWYRIGANMSAPEWVAPEREGSGLPKLTVDGEPYYFNRDAMVVDEQTGAFVAVHREGEADPINLQDPAYPGIDTDLMERTINMEAESEPPGLLDGLGGMSMQTLTMGAIVVSFVIYAGFRLLG